MIPETLTKYCQKFVTIPGETGQEQGAADFLKGVMEELGFERDRQNFVPHLTIGRIKFIQDKNHFSRVIGGYKGQEFERMVVNEFELIESRLQPTGPVYTVLESFELS